jgi:hypothetical protein
VISFPWQLIILSNPEGICVKGAMLVVCFTGSYESCDGLSHIFGECDDTINSYGSKTSVYYEGTSRILQTGAAIYIAVMVVQSTGKW